MKKLLLALAITILIGSLATLVIVSINNKNTFTEVPYMTEEEVIEKFYSNYDIFKMVAEYVLSTTGSYDIQIYNKPRGAYAWNNGYDLIALDDLELGEEIKHLVYDLGFNLIVKDETETKVFFQISFENTSAKGIEYLSNGGVPDRFEEDYTPLEYENWYYYLIPGRG